MIAGAALTLRPSVDFMRLLTTIRPDRVARLVDQLLHPVRRRNARAGIAARALPDSVVFVCRANLCRSPYAAAVLRRALADTNCSHLTIDSAGFMTESCPVPTNVAAVAQRRGVDLSEHHSASLSRARVLNAGLVVVVEPLQVRLLRICYGELNVPVLVLGDVDPVNGGERAIADPMPRAESSFDETYERIDRCVAELARLLSARAG